MRVAIGPYGQVDDYRDVIGSLGRHPVGILADGDRDVRGPGSGNKDVVDVERRVQVPLVIQRGRFGRRVGVCRPERVDQTMLFK
jgi:hypothetical protein